MPPRAIAVANQKGGAGKTSTTINLGAALAELGAQVLMVDLDPQCALTATCNIDPYQATRTSYTLLTREHVSPVSCIRTVAPNLHVLPGSVDLAAAEVMLTGDPQAPYRLREAFDKMRAPLDYVLFDTPPSLGLLTVNALVAAEAVVIPVQCEYLALEGLGQLVETINRVRVALNPSLHVRGVVMTMFDARTGLSSQVVGEVRKHFPGKVFKSIIPRSVRLAEAPSHGVPISAYATTSSGAQAYRALAEELLKGDRDA